MSNHKYNNEFLRQIREVPNTVKQMSEVINTEVFETSVPDEVLKSTNRVILTGAGDSYFAGIVAKPTFENIETSTSTGMIPGVPTETERVVEFTRYYDTYRRFWLSDENEIYPLVVGVSISGSPTRMTEAMARANKYKGVSVAFTNNVDSSMANEAQHTVPLNVPENKFCPAVTSYIASTYALTQFGLHYSKVRGKLSKEEATKQREAMLEYASKYTDDLMREIEKRCLAITQKWLDDGIEMMDFIADGPDYATAYFGSAKMVESFGGLTTYDDSEEWNHINYFFTNVKKVGTFVVANEKSPSFSRLKETINTAVALGRPTIIITDADKNEFPEEAEVFTLPKAEYQWMNPIMQHIPMDFIAAYMGVLQDIPWFVTDSPLHLKDNDADRFRKSEIVII